jgi:hypothetical protein
MNHDNNLAAEERLEHAAAHTAFVSRFHRDGCDKMNDDAWANWVNALPLDEFFAMMALGSGRD